MYIRFRLISKLLCLQVAHKNRSFYRQLRTDLHDLSTDGLYLQQSLLNEGANAMQKLSGIYLDLIFEVAKMYLDVKEA